MDVKLTLKLDKQVIEKAKSYAASQKRSLSRLVEAYLQSLIEQDQDNDKEVDISPYVKSLSTGIKVPSDIDDKKAYHDHLTEKYK